MQVVRAGPDIDEDQRPKVDDRQFIAEHRALGLFGHKVIHHPQEARCQEKAHSVVAIPPLRHGVLHAREYLHRFRTKNRNRDRQVVDQVQHRNGNDEGQVKPVGHVDMRLFALYDGAHEHRQIRHPNDGEPPIDIPFRLGIFFRLGCPQNIACRGQHDDQLETPKHEPSQVSAPQPRRAGALHHVKRGCNQRVAAKGKNHRRGVQRTQFAKIQIALRPFKIKHRKGQLKGNRDAHQKTNNAPKSGGNNTGAHNAIHIFARNIAVAYRFVGVAKRP